MKLYLSDCSILKTRPDLVKRYRKLLTSAESERFNCQSSDLHQYQFLMGRAMIRDICGQSPEITVTGKPVITDGYISLSHSGQYVVLAVSDTPVGIDIEDTARIRDFDALAARMGWTLGQDKKSDFYRAFTRYESRYKLGTDKGDFSDIYYSIKTFIICVTKLNNKEKIDFINLLPFERQDSITLTQMGE